MANSTGKTTQTVKQTTKQPAKQPAKPPAKQPAKQPVKQPVKQPTKQTDKNLIDALDGVLGWLGIKYEHQGDLFWIFNRSGDLPVATFLVVPKDSRISFFSALPFEVRAERLEDALFVINALNDVVPAGRFYIDVNTTDNAIFFDQYLLAPDGELNAKDIDRMIKNNAAVMKQYVDLFIEVNEGLLKVTDFIKIIWQE